MNETEGGSKFRMYFVVATSFDSIRHGAGIRLQNDPNADPRPITTASAMMAPTMPTITMSK
jgi:hypothetical protein